MRPPFAELLAGGNAAIHAVHAGQPVHLALAPRPERLMELERPVIGVVSISYAIEHRFPFGSHMHDQALCFVLLTQDLPLAS
jgi:hypothetical protein